MKNKMAGMDLHEYLLSQGYSVRANFSSNDSHRMELSERVRSWEMTIGFHGGRIIVVPFELVPECGRKKSNEDGTEYVIYYREEN